ncbi:hypothetical protein [Ramlibacter sp. AN1133]|uniref:hypothetical protein n=1 Tax=Ramlibacter sp. AN1133 TaxID=3133429 RepID=UPI0030BF7284
MSWQLAALLLLSLVTGAAGGALVALNVFMQDAEPIARELARKNTRIQLLELLVQQHSPASYDSLASVPQPPVASSVPAATPATSATHSVAPAAHLSPVPARQARTDARTSTKSAAAAPAAMPLPAMTIAAKPQLPQAEAARQAEIPSSVEQKVTRPAPTEAVSGEELVLAMKARIEGAPAQKAGVKSLEKGAVVLLNGGTVRVGQVFPSGEKLLQVDPENNRVVTTKRQMLLFFQE